MNIQHQDISKLNRLIFMYYDRVWSIEIQRYANEFEYYERYHQNWKNVVIHTFSIPLELLSVLMIMPSSNTFNTIALLYCILIGIYCSFVCRSHLGKLLVLPLHCMILLLNFIIKFYCMENNYIYALTVAIIIHLSSWFIQVIIGHFYFERNVPGMTNKLTFYSIIISNSLALDSFISHFIEKTPIR
jgi:uncharacterized membrane protein YGL010W